MSDSEITLRRATPDDASRLWAMHRTSLLALGAGYYSARQIEAFLSEVGTVEEAHLADGTYLVIEAGRDIAASGGWTLRRPSYASRPPEDFPDRHPSGRATIRAVFTHPRYARLGLASRIMAICEAEAASRGGASVLELCATLSGVPLYRKLGYRTGPAFRVPLSHGESFAAVVMTKRVAEPLRAAA